MVGTAFLSQMTSHLKLPSEDWTPAKSTHNECCSSVTHWPRTGAHTHGPTPTHVPVAPALGHLAEGSKAVCRSNQSSQWATPINSILFHQWWGDHQRGLYIPGVLRSRSNPFSQWPEIRLQRHNCLLWGRLTCRQNCVIFVGGETKTDIAHFPDTTGEVKHN